MWPTIFFFFFLSFFFFFEASALLNVRHCPNLQSCAISRKTNDANLRKWQKKAHFESNFGPPNFFPRVLPLLIDIVPSYHSMQFKRKLMNQTLENSNKSNFGPKFRPKIFFSWVWPLLDVRHCRKLLSNSISCKTYDPNSRKWWKTLIWAWFRPVETKFGPPYLFL